MKYTLTWIFSCLAWLISGSMEAEAQGTVYSISGVIKNSQNERIAGATVLLQTDARELGTQSSLEGEFLFRDVEPGRYTITISYIGYVSYRDSLHVTSEDLFVDVELEERIEDLGQVTVTGRSESREAREQPVRAAVVNTSTVLNQAVSLPELMSRTAGIRVRQTGGLGSATEVSINGYQGRSVRYFKDGIPLNYLPDGYSIASVPVNQLQRVEVYKGVLPVFLGADALGGAVNLVSRNELITTAALSYEIASFNTHRLSFSGNYIGENSRWFAGVGGFYNVSDNSYKANVMVTDPETRNQFPERLPLFHNGYQGYYTEMFGGLRDQPWADELRFSLAAVYSSKEEQHPALMTDPYGAAESRQSTIVPTLRYVKTLGDDKLHIDQFLAYNTLNTARTDTLRGSFDWYGNFTPNPQSRGESRQPALSDVDFRTFTSRTYARLRLSTRQHVELNLVLTDVIREGIDPYGPRFEGTDIDVLSEPASYRKWVASAGWSIDLGEKVTTTLMGKYFLYSSTGVDAWQARNISADETVTQTGHTTGIAGAIRYQVLPNSLIRISAEAANRLPEQGEIFGNGVWTVPNFNLNPEKSINANLGFRRDIPDRYSFETNLFWRQSRGMILMVPIQAPYAQYMNIENIRGMGAEADVSVHMSRFLTMNANVTWQNLRIFDLESPTDRWKEDARLRNTPYFFYNMGLHGNFTGLFAQNDELQIQLNYSFVREFYLETIPKRAEPGGFLGLIGSADVQTRLIIPDQHLLNAGLSYHPFGRSLSIGIDVKNILNEDLYDNYRIQKPGRSFHAKINYSFN